MYTCQQVLRPQVQVQVLKYKYKYFKRVLEYNSSKSTRPSTHLCYTVFHTTRLCLQPLFGLLAHTDRDTDRYVENDTNCRYRS